ncbi:membrane protein [Gordonia phage Bonum]|nr:membrane protein [Gordonia phage Bonum]
MNENKQPKDPDVDPDLVHIGFVLDGAICRMNIPANLARKMGMALFDEADLVEGKTPLRERLRRRWKPGGRRDFQNFLSGVGVGWLVVTISSGVAFQNHTAAIGAGLLTSATIALQCQRHFQDRRDLDEEMREKRYQAETGADIDATTGQLPWEILR